MKILTLILFAIQVSISTFGQIIQPKIDSLIKRKIEGQLYQPQAENGESGIVILTISKPKDSVLIETSFSSYGDKWYERRSSLNLSSSLNLLSDIIPKHYKVIVPIEYHCMIDSITHSYAPDPISIKTIKNLLNQNITAKLIIFELKLKVIKAMEIH